MRIDCCSLLSCLPYIEKQNVASKTLKGTKCHTMKYCNPTTETGRLKSTIQRILADSETKQCREKMKKEDKKVRIERKKKQENIPL